MSRPASHPAPSAPGAAGVAAPRDYTAQMHSMPALSGAHGMPGMPGDRLALLAARRAFVALKLTFLEATEGVPGPQAGWLRQQVRGAEEPVDLWLLRAPLFSALSGHEPALREARQRVRRALDAVFPDSQPTTAFGAL